MIPLLLEACPSFGTIWGPIQRPDEHQEHIIHIAFGAFGSHLVDLSRKGITHELYAVNAAIERFQIEGDDDVKRLTAHLVESIRSLSSNEKD